MEAGFYFSLRRGGGNMGWCVVGTVIRESSDLSEYPCEYARALPVQQLYFLLGGGGGEHGPMGGGRNIPRSPPPPPLPLR